MHPSAGIHTDKLGRCLTTYPTKAYPFQALFKYHLPGASSRCCPGVTSLEDWDSTVELYLHIGAGGRNRIRNLLITNQWLCQLSYASINRKSPYALRRGIQLKLILLQKQLFRLIFLQSYLRTFGVTLLPLLPFYAVLEKCGH